MPDNNVTYGGLLNQLANSSSNGLSAQALAQRKAKMAMEEIDAFNANPRQFSDANKMRIAALAQEYGRSIEEAASKDVPRPSEAWMAGLGGAVDSVVLGAVPDKWYSTYRTDGYKNIGKTAGSALSLLIPGRNLFGGAKAIAGVGKAAKTFNTATKPVNSARAIAKYAKAIDTAVDTEKALGAADDIARAADILRKSSNADEIAGAIKVLEQSSPNIAKLYAASKATKPLGYAVAAKNATNALKTVKPSDYIKAAYRISTTIPAARNMSTEPTTPPYIKEMERQRMLGDLGQIQQ